MGNNDNLDLDDELVRSIEKLVEEETNVAKAYVDNSSGDNVDNTYTINRDSHKANTISPDGTVRKHTDASYSGLTLDLGATRMIDSEAVESISEKKTVSPVRLGSESLGSERATDSDLYGKNDESRTKESGRTTTAAKVVKQGAGSQTRQTSASEKNTASNKKMITIATAVVLVAVIAIVAVAVAVNVNNKKSYAYNYDKGMSLYESGDTLGAIGYFAAAYETTEGKRNVDMMGILADLYLSSNDKDNAIAVLKSILEYDVQNTEALGKLAKIYYDNSDGAALTALIEKYDGNKASAALDEYKVNEPSPSEKPGTLAEPVELTLIAQDGCNIYYTIDGSEPTTKSTHYVLPFLIEKDTVTVKAIAVNGIGVTSKTATLKYTVSLQAPDAPELSIEESTISEGTVIRINNLEDGSKAYYTVDGTTPTANSIIYNDGIELKSGSYVLSVVIVNKSNLSSAITRKNITVEAAISYAEAVSILKNRMTELNILNANGYFVSNTRRAAEFTNQGKKTIDGTEMYYIKMTGSDGSQTEYYGVGVNDRRCYKVTGSGSSLKAVEY